MLLKRILTAVILLALVLWVLLTDMPYVFPAFSALVLLIAAWEWAGLSNLQTKMSKVGYLIYIALFFGLCLFLPVVLNLSLVILLWAWMFLAVVLYSNQKSLLGLNHAVVRLIVGAPVLVIAWLAVNILRQQIEGLTWTLYVLVLIFIVDSSAFFVGKYFGKRPLTKQVSPNKTWEGVVGGVAGGLIFTAVILPWLPVYWEGWRIFPIAFITIIFAVMGDLVESLFKRLAHVKDSGNLLPGHGGVLDRIDSIIATVPLFVFLQLGVFS